MLSMAVNGTISIARVSAELSPTSVLTHTCTCFEALISYDSTRSYLNRYAGSLILAYLTMQEIIIV